MKAGSTQVELLFNHCNCNSRYSIDKNTQLKVYFMRFLSLQDRFGQKHVVEVLKEELEEGRWASFTLSANLEIKKKKKKAANIFSFFQFGFTWRVRRLRMERHDSALQRGGQKEVKIFLEKIVDLNR